jgi:UDP-glucose 4-epimerase
MGAGFDTVLFDNHCNSSASVVDRIEQITGKRPPLVKGDTRDRDSLDATFAHHHVD